VVLRLEGLVKRLSMVWAGALDQQLFAVRQAVAQAYAVRPVL
jgi:hypothetical protein